MKNLKFTFILIIFNIFSSYAIKGENIPLKGNRFLTFNTIIRVNQIEVSRNKNAGVDERTLHSPEKIIKFREAIEKGFPGSKITWAFSWLALNDTTRQYQTIR